MKFIISQKQEKIYTLILIGLFSMTLSNSSFAQINKATDELLDCPNIPLLKDAPLDVRQRSTNMKDEPLYLSKHFCMALDSLTTPKPEGGFPTRYTKNTYSNMYINYKKAYESLPNIEQKLSFVHLFLSILSHQSTLTGKSAATPKAVVWVWVKYREELFAWSEMKLMPDLGALEALTKLRKLQSNPPKPEDNPVLTQLIEQVIDGSRIMTDEDVYALTAQLR